MTLRPLLLALAFVSTTSFAADPAPATPAPGTLPERMKSADANGDGLLDKEEAKAFPRLAKRFDQIDTDKDGKLSPAELEAVRERIAERRKH